MDNKPVGFFNYKKDLYLEQSLLGKEDDLQKKMEDKLKAIIQTYNGRLIDNDMIVRKQK
jgi:hypothetical protein